MIGALLFLAVIIGVPFACGLPVAWFLMERGRRLPVLRGMAGFVAIWLMGLVVAVLIATMLSALGLGWGRWGAVIAGLLGLVGAALILRERGLRAEAPGERPRAWPLPLSLVLGIVILLVAVALHATVATSADLTFFWGSKALHFARAGGIDFEMQREPYMMHTHVTYPPAWTYLLAWGSMAAGELPWMAVPWLTLLGLVASLPLVKGLLESRLGAAAAPVSGLWLVVVAAGLIASLSAGNAAMLLLLFETVAMIILTADLDLHAEKPGRGRPWSALGGLAAISLAGAVLTKSEGVVAVVLILAGVVVRGLVRGERGVWRRVLALGAPATAVWLFWLVVRLGHGLPFSDPIREQMLVISLDQLPEIAKASVQNIGMGTAGMSWLAPAVLVLICRRRGLVRQLVDVLPALSLSLGLIGFAGVYYLHVRGDVVTMITWTLPRLALPALSAWIIAAGLLCFARPESPLGSDQRVQA